MTIEDNTLLIFSPFLLGYCNCGCGKNLHKLNIYKKVVRYIPTHNSTRINHNYHCSKCKDKNWLIECICGYCNDVIVLRDMNLRVKKFKHSHNSNGKNSYGYKGQSDTGNGYKYVTRFHHKFADKRGRVLRHRYEMELQIGRYLTKDEEVHHINENKLDNRIENLQLLSKKEHRILHLKMRKNKSKKEHL
ncbi:MAG TPA: HNH endonuclease [Candidatus Nitrosocosmicus sp.]|nr:HNH endonuclease [Candidatus Nitrosocosmicus sp.]